MTSITLDTGFVIEASMNALTYNNAPIVAYSASYDLVVNVSNISASGVGFVLVVPDTSSNTTTTSLADMFDASGNFKLYPAYNGNYEESPYFFATTSASGPVPFFRFGSDDRYASLNTTSGTTYATTPLYTLADISSNLAAVATGGGLSEAAVYAQAGALTGSVLLNPFNNVKSVADALDASLNAQFAVVALASGPWAANGTNPATKKIANIPATAPFPALHAFPVDASSNTLADKLLITNINTAGRLALIEAARQPVTINYVDTSGTNLNTPGTGFAYPLVLPGDTLFLTAKINNSPITGLTMTPPSGFSGGVGALKFETIQAKIKFTPVV
jgi:hypothetical protein